jgi:hypothetical protein
VGRPVAGVPGSEGPIDINAAKKGKIRYEFIVLLVWKEPVRDIGDGALGGVASMPASPGMMP